MGSIEVAIALVILVAFGMGAIIGVVLIVSVASKHEDRLYSLWGAAPGAACHGVRRLVGLSVRGGWPLSGAGSPDTDDTGPGQEPER